MSQKKLVIIPAFNEASVIGGVVRSVKQVLPDIDILVVDDGSGDTTAKAAKIGGARVISHYINRGLGGAIGTGLAYALANNYAQAVTFDADGQHSASDLAPIFDILDRDKADVVIGTRMHRLNVLPMDRWALNWLANGLTFLLFGIRTSDSQSGFRGFNRKAIELIRIKTDRMEVSSEIFGEISRLKLKYKEYPIKVKYTEYSRLKGQKNTNAIPVIMRLIMRLFR